MSDLGLALSKLGAADNDVLTSRDNTVGISGNVVASINASLVDYWGSRLVNAVHRDSIGGFFEFDSL